MFIIYNTFAIAVTQRRGEIGILRALGATRSQIRTLFLTESAVAGLVGTLAGVAFGIAMARAMAGYIGTLLADVYGIAQQAEHIEIDPWLIAAAVAMGVITSLIAAVIPARSAAGVDPVKALQKGRYQSMSEGENRLRRRWALACAVASVATLTLNRNSMIFYAGYLLAVLAAVLLSPGLAHWLAQILRPAFAWIRAATSASRCKTAPRGFSAPISALRIWKSATSTVQFQTSGRRERTMENRIAPHKTSNTRTRICG
jgi:putative ABC transport system permease protein